MTNGAGGHGQASKTLACLHAHHANIPALDGMFPDGTVEVVHDVDPG